MTWSSPEPIAYFLTWTTYGSWLPGDERGWVEKPGRFRGPDQGRKEISQSIMTEPVCSLDPEQRQLVEDTVQDHCRVRGWQLHEVNCRTQHVHVVFSAPIDPDRILREFKAWCTRRLKGRNVTTSNDQAKLRKNWWTESGSKRSLFDDDSLEAAIIYVRDCQ